MDYWEHTASRQARPLRNRKGWSASLGQCIIRWTLGHSKENKQIKPTYPESCPAPTQRLYNPPLTKENKSHLIVLERCILQGVPWPRTTLWATCLLYSHQNILYSMFFLSLSVCECGGQRTTSGVILPLVPTLWCLNHWSGGCTLGLAWHIRASLATQQIERSVSTSLS